MSVNVQCTYLDFTNTPICGVYVRLTPVTIADSGSIIYSDHPKVEETDDFGIAKFSNVQEATYYVELLDNSKHTNFFIAVPTGSSDITLEAGNLKVDV